MAFCTNCGEQLSDGSKFCSNCGATTVIHGNGNHRKTVFDGEIHKCPNCGEVLQSFVAICPACGHELRGRQSSNSIKEFSVKLAEAETGMQKISLIQSFPIPNTKEDIFEFIILASSYFDTDFFNTGDFGAELSDAWRTKIEQSYQKSKLLFRDDKDFSKIQDLYNQTHCKIKKSTQRAKRKFLIDLALRTTGLWVGLIIFIIAFVVDVSSYRDTSIYHLSAGIVMIIGALMIGRKSKPLVDVGVGIVCGVVTILLGTLLQNTFFRNGSVMELAGVATIIISIVRLVKSFVKK